MHILLDARPFVYPKHSFKQGIYCEDFFQALFRNFPSDIFYVWTTGKKRPKNFFSFSLEIYPNVKRIHTHIYGKKIDFLMKNFSYPKIDDIVETEAMKRGLLPWVGKFDVGIFLAPYISPVEENCLKVLFVNDFSELHFPEYFSKQKSFYSTKNYKREIKSSDLICVPSEFVKNDLKETFTFEEEKIFVVNVGILEKIKNQDLLNREETEEQDEKKKFLLDSLPEKFFFARGIFSELHNFDALIESYILYRERFQHKKNDLWSLVIEEEKEGNLYEFSSQQKGKELDIIVIPPLTQEERIEVLEKAKAFLYPSLYDGIGKPILEAMRCGTPVLSSSFGALPEIYKESALSFDPTSRLSILRAMKRIFLEKDLQNKLSLSGKDRSYSSTFLWDDIVERFMHRIQESREEKDEELEEE